MFCNSCHLTVRFLGSCELYFLIFFGFLQTKRKDENEQEIQLNIRKVAFEHFRKYSLVVENLVSVSNQHVFLRESGFYSVHVCVYVRVFIHQIIAYFINILSTYFTTRRKHLSCIIRENFFQDIKVFFFGSQI